MIRLWNFYSLLIFLCNYIYNSYIRSTIIVTEFNISYRFLIFVIDFEIFKILKFSRNIKIHIFGYFQLFLKFDIHQRYYFLLINNFNK